MAGQFIPYAAVQQVASVVDDHTLTNIKKLMKNLPTKKGAKSKDLNEQASNYSGYRLPSSLPKQPNITQTNPSSPTDRYMASFNMDLEVATRYPSSHVNNAPSGITTTGPDAHIDPAMNKTTLLLPITTSASGQVSLNLRHYFVDLCYYIFL